MKAFLPAATNRSELSNLLLHAWGLIMQQVPVRLMASPLLAGDVPLLEAARTSTVDRTGRAAGPCACDEHFLRLFNVRKLDEHGDSDACGHLSTVLAVHCPIAAAMTAE